MINSITSIPVWFVLPKLKVFHRTFYSRSFNAVSYGQGRSNIRLIVVVLKPRVSGFPLLKWRWICLDVLRPGLQLRRVLRFEEKLACWDTLIEYRIPILSVICKFFYWNFSSSNNVISRQILVQASHSNLPCKWLYRELDSLTPHWGFAAIIIYFCFVCLTIVI